MEKNKTCLALNIRRKRGGLGRGWDGMGEGRGLQYFIEEKKGERNAIRKGIFTQKYSLQFFLKQ